MVRERNVHIYCKGCAAQFHVQVPRGSRQAKDHTIQHLELAIRILKDHYYTEHPLLDPCTNKEELDRQLVDMEFKRQRLLERGAVRQSQ